MRARTATVGDLEAVFSDLANRFEEDYVSSGLGMRNTKDAFVMNLKEGRAYALVEGDQPLAIVAWSERDGAVYTLFAARRTFFTASTVRFCKKHIRQIQALEGNLPLRHRSWLDSPSVAKWFRLIGFVEHEGEPGSTLYELPPARDFLPPALKVSEGLSMKLTTKQFGLGIVAAGARAGMTVTQAAAQVGTR